MTMPEVTFKTVAIQNSSPWPCSMCPFPQLRLWGWGHPIYIFLIFPGCLEFWTPLQIPIWGSPLGCTLLQSHGAGHLKNWNSCLVQTQRPFFRLRWSPEWFYPLKKVFTGNMLWSVLALTQKNICRKTVSFRTTTVFHELYLSNTAWCARKSNLI